MELIRLVALILAVSCVVPLCSAADKPTTLPSADEIMARHVEATGGRAAREAVKTFIVTGTFDVPAQRLSGKVALHVRSPGKFRSTLEAPGLGRQEQGYDAVTDVGWGVSDLQGVVLVSDDERWRMKVESDLLADVNWKTYYKAARVAGVENLDGANCHRVDLTTLTGRPETRFYDLATGLLVRQRAEMEVSMGLAKTDTRFSDYRDVGGGLKFAFKHDSTADIGGQGRREVLAVDKVELNVPIPDEKFAIPDDVKKLVEKSKRK